MSYNSPQEISVLFKKSAVQKNAFSTGKLAFYSVLGGAYISLGGLLAIVVAGGMPGVAASNPGLVKFVFGAVFPLGLILVVIAGAELFTSDCAAMPYGLMAGSFGVKRLARAWVIVYLGNFVGALIVAYLFAYQSKILQSDPWLTSAQNIGVLKTSGTFLKTFVKGIGANWLVCLAVWMGYSAKDTTGKILALWFPIMAFVAFGFEHSIANMFFIPVSMLLGADISMYDFLVTNLVPATLGNIVGGAVFVAMGYYFMFEKGSDSGSIQGENGSKPVQLKNILRVKKHLN